jgi:hypothetical protein
MQKGVSEMLKKVKILVVVALVGAALAFVSPLNPGSASPLNAGQSPRYVSYYDCSGWSSVVEIMNLQNQQRSYRIAVFAGSGSQIWSEVHTLPSYATERIWLCAASGAQGSEGIVEVSPLEDGDEFPSLMILADEGRDFTEANRFVPFMRVP